MLFNRSIQVLLFIEIDLQKEKESLHSIINDRKKRMKKNRC